MLEKLPEKRQLLQQKLRPCMQIIINLLDKFVVEKSIATQDSLLQQLKQDIVKLSEIKTDFLAQEDSRALEAICFSLNRVLVCFEKLIEYWNRIH